LGLAKVTIVNTFGKIRHYTLCSGVAACMLHQLVNINIYIKMHVATTKSNNGKLLVL